MEEPAFDRDKVRALMKERGITQTKMAKVAKLPAQSAFSNILKGTRRVTAGEAALIYRFLGIATEPSYKVASVIGIASAGRWREAIEMPIGRMPYPHGVAGDRAFGIEVADDSMNNLIDDGGWVLVDPDRKELRPGSVYLISNGEGDAMIKMYQRSPARFEPCSRNDMHESFLISDADFHVIGQVVWKGGPVS